jgi:outer membrane protein OmpA-like peptidoglycan-associated protein
MKYPRLIVMIVAVWFALGMRPGFAAPDEYDDSQSHPLRIVAYLIHPAAWLVEWAVFRPFHALVSASEPMEAVFGHEPHPPVLAEPQPVRDYGMPRRVPVKPAPPPAPVAAAPEPIREVVKLVEVPKETIVYRDVQKVVEVEKFVFPGIAFQFDSAELTDWGKGNVYLAAEKLKAKGDISVVIEGHTDEVGSAEYNKNLGLRRAQRVMTELAALGVDQARISTATQGEEKPLINQPTAWARAVNRRVEFEVRGK